MKKLRIIIVIILSLLSILFAVGCKRINNASVTKLERQPNIEPDYKGVTIPVNIAPLNFIIKEEGTGIKLGIRSGNGSETEIKLKNGIASFPLRKWKELLNESRGGRIEVTLFTSIKGTDVKKYAPFSIYVANEPVDPYLCYRLLYPGYESWSEMQVIQRSTGDFNEKIVIDNEMLDGNCVNCHTFLNNNPEKFLIHLRGSLNGTYIVNGKEVTRRSLKTGKMIANAVYPAWHPSSRYITFSSNEIVEAFHMLSDKNIEVYDHSALLVNYDCEKDEISPVEESDSPGYIETFPCWSADGCWLYYCRTEQLIDNFDYRNVHYDLVKRHFDNPTGLFGEAEMVFDAHETGKSVSLPQISPDGNWLIFVLHDYGTFSIWHKEADLYLLDLRNGRTERMSLNSDEAESWHSWSSNGRWIVFSSKRGDGLTARPYIAYFSMEGKAGKPFVLPQKDPELYNRMGKTFNRPEFITGKIIAGPRDFAMASKKAAVNAKWSEPGK